jgi:hypothetical protein
MVSSAALLLPAGRGPCAGEPGPHSGVDTPGAAPAPSLAGSFTRAPLDPSEILEIVPLGNVSPRGGHVLPTDHVYFEYGGKAGLAVRAPADGTVFAVRDQVIGDSKIEVRVNDHLSYYVAHLLPEPGVVAGARVTAGQVLGKTSGRSMLDLGAYDSRVRLRGLMNPARYPDSTLQTVSPLALFAEPQRTQLYDRVRREGPDRDGRIDFDEPGRLVGNWFHASLTPGGPAGGPGSGGKELAFIFDVHRPTAVRVSIGGAFAPPGAYAVQADAPDPRTVSVATGLVKYVLSEPPPRRGSGPGGVEAAPTPPIGTLLVQLVGADTLKVEFFLGKGPSGVERFTAAAQTYLR